ncbi:MAG: hypothetical protein PW788_11680 [Micavibrio sp.]|nr:hypothetical protein [Micavibrio sp.]
MDFQDKLTAAKKWLLGTRSVDEAEEGIKQSQLWKASLATWSSRLGKVAIGVGVVAFFSRGLVFMGVAAGVGIAYGAVKLASYLLDKNIEMKKRAELEMLQEAQGKGPQPSAKPAAGLKFGMKAKATGAFNADAARPANDDATATVAATQPKKTFLSRFGL